MHREMSVIVLIGIVAPGVGPFAAAQDATAPESAHLVLSVVGSGARINRMDWDLNAFALSSYYRTEGALFSALGATTQANTLLDMCGSRNCTGGQ